MGWTIWVPYPGRKKRFSLLQIVYIGAGDHPAACTMGTDVLCRGRSGRGVNVTTHHLAPRIRHTFPPPICLPGGHRDHLLYLPLITRLKHCVPGTGLPGLKLTSHVWCRSLKKASYTSHPLCR